MAICRYLVVGIVIILVGLACTGSLAAQRPTDCTGICDLAWSSTEQALLGAVDEFGLWLYEVDENNSTHQFFPREHSISLSFDSQGQYAAVISCVEAVNPADPCHGSLSLFDIQERMWKLLGTYDYSISNVKFSPDGRYIAFQKDEIGEWGIQLIDLVGNKSFSIVDPNHTNAVINYAFDSQSAHIAISNGLYGYEGHDLWGLSVWRLSDQTLQAFTEGSVLVADLTFTEIDREVIFVQYDTHVSVWNYDTGAILSLRRIRENVFDNLNSLSFSYPPTHLLGSLLDDWHPGDRELYVWDIQTGEHVFFSDMPEDTFTDLITMSHNGDYVAYSSTVDEQKVINIWEQVTGLTRQIKLFQ